VKGSRSEPDADEDRDEGFDEGGKDTEGPWGRRAEAWRRPGDEPKIAFFLRITARHEGWSRRRHEDMKMTAVEKLPKTFVRKAERHLGMMGGAQAAHCHCERCVIYRD